MPLIKPARRRQPPETPASDTHSVGDLMLMLESDERDIRRSAIGALSRHPEAALALCQQLEVETDEAISEMIALSLTRMGGSMVVDGLLPMLRSDNATLRNTAIDILKELPTEVAPHMEALLDDPDPDVRILVINVLEALRHPKVEDWLIAVISVDGHVNVVATALDLLGEVGTVAAISALASVNRRFPDEPFIAFAVTNALKQIQSAD
ncbi:HEAT repeat domain-containing protein [Rhizobium sp. CG5]|uniref:HEAT repeat domain-containing protein n=1 Tax=Rhizobium sp. CG5 TaxID=2726076 RepID=UPI002034A224|nr:HEAT repeat domain-containing protein [Rhizobium sp. CG5]MCM2475037.1 HEAT repeat domain-containing protein [Rhizobium sp. CG5]